MQANRIRFREGHPIQSVSQCGQVTLDSDPQQQTKPNKAPPSWSPETCPKRSGRGAYQPLEVDGYHNVGEFALACVFVFRYTTYPVRHTRRLCKSFTGDRRRRRCSERKFEEEEAVARSHTHASPPNEFRVIYDDKSVRLVVAGSSRRAGERCNMGRKVSFTHRFSECCNLVLLLATSTCRDD